MVCLRGLKENLLVSQVKGSYQHVTRSFSGKFGVLLILHKWSKIKKLHLLALFKKPKNMSMFFSITRVPSKLKGDVKAVSVFKGRVNYLVRKVTADITYTQ